MTNSKDILFSILQGKNIPHDLLQVIINMYKNDAIIIKLSDHTTDCQSINQRVGEECPWHQH